MKRSTKFLTLLLAATLCLEYTPALNVSAETEAARAAEIVTVNPSIRYQTMDGWGTTVAWWGNIVGGWDDADKFNDPSEGTDNDTDRSPLEHISELLFSAENGIGLNIIRYNIGGGENPTHNHMLRVEGKMPGYVMPGEDIEDPDAFIGDTSDPNAYDWEADANQVTAMKEAIRMRADEDDMITEFFSNSPPYWMTNSLCATGAANSSRDNLKDEYYDDFAKYLTTVTEHFVDEGVQVDYLVPLNEPASSYWGAGSEKQEGAHFDAGTSQSKLYEEVNSAMEEAGLYGKGVQLSGLDETSVSVGITSYNKLSSGVKDMVQKYNVHTYGGSYTDRVTLRNLMASEDTSLWMSEVCYSSGGHDHDSMASALTLSSGVLTDLKDMEVSAWVYWQAVENELECLLWNGNWGLISAAFEEDGPNKEYHNKNGLDLSDASKNRYGLEWGKDIKQGDYWITKQYYAMGQYSKFIKQGYTIIDSGDSDMLAAISPDGKTMVIVATNSTSTAQNRTFLLAGTEGLNAAVTAYRTSGTEGLAELDNIAIYKDQFFDAVLKPESITTYVITADDSMYNEGTSKIVDDYVVAGTSDINKFNYSMTGTSSDWSSYYGQAGAYSTSVHYSNTTGASAEVKFEGTQAQLYGSIASDAGILEYYVDDVYVGTTDAYSATRMERQLLADTGQLEYGDHTLKIVITGTKNVSSGGAYITLDYAKVTEGDISGLFATPVLTSARAWDGGVMVSFEPLDGAGSYIIEYGTASGSYTEKVDNITGSSYYVSGLVNGVTYYFVVKAVTGGVESDGSNEMAATPGAVNDSGTIYYVDAGTGNTSTLKAGESYGTYNSALDQSYDYDPITGKAWGYSAQTQGGSTWARTNEGVESGSAATVDESDNVARYYTQRHGQSNSGFYYTFELPKGEYDVSIGFAEMWNGRTFNVKFNSELMEKISLTSSDRNKLITKYYKASVGEDGMLQIHFERVSDNPMVSWIKIDSISNAPGLSGATAWDSSVLLEYGKIDGAESYIIEYGTQPGTYTEKITGITDKSYLVTGLENGTTYYFAVSAVADGVQTDRSNELSAAPVAQKIGASLYYVNAGTGNTSPQSGTDYDQGYDEYYGKYNSNLDQAYGLDQLTGKTWGWTLDGGKTWANGASGSPFASIRQAENDGSNATKGLKYTFELLDGDYQVTVGFMELWDNQGRVVDVKVNDEKVDTVSLGNTANVPIIKYYDVTVTDGELELYFGKNSGNPLVNWIQIDAMSIYDISVDSVNIPNGSVIANMMRASAGETVYITVVPDEGYQLKEGSLMVNSIAVTEQGADPNTYIFTMPEEDVTISAEFEPIPVDEPTLVSAVPGAFVKKLSGNKNDLTITITETYSDDSVVIITETISISNNAAGTYEIGGYKVYVNTKGNDQIRDCYIVD